MENEFIIFDYLDGEMNPEQEQAFFNLLSQNEELRTEFKQQLALKNSFVADLRSFTPDPKSTMGIFTKLGISATAVTAASNAIGTAGGSSFLTTLSSYFSATVVKSILATLAISTSAFIALFQSDIIDWESESKNNKTEIVKQNLNSNTSNSNQPDDYTNNNIGNNLDNNSNEKLTNLSENSTSNSINKEIIIKYNYIFTFDTLKLKGDEKLKATQFLNNAKHIINSSQATNNLIQNHITTSEIYQTKYNTFSLSNHFTANSIPIKNNYYKSDINNIHLPLTVEIGYGQFNNSLLNEIDLNRQYTNLNNIKMNLLYRFNNNISAGVNFSNENYYQNFNILTNNGRILEYHQKPEFNVLSASLRYSPTFLKFGIKLLDFQPIIQAAYGSDLNGGGFVSRVGTGINLHINRSAYFQILGEYSNLNYKQGNLNYNSNRIGINFGFGYRLGE